MRNITKVCFILFADIFLFLGCSLDINFESLQPSAEPLVNVEMSTTNKSLNSLASFSVSLSFNKEVVDLSESSIHVSGGNLVADSLAGSGKNYSFSVVPSGEGVVQIGFPEQEISVVGSATSKKTNSSLISVEIDTTAATVQLTTAVASPTPLTSIPINVTFSEPVTGLEISDFEISGDGAGASIISLTGSGAVYQITILPVLTGKIYVELPLGQTQDSAGNLSFASNELEISYQTAPTGDLGISIAGPTPSLGSHDTEFVWTVNYTGAWVVDLNTVSFIGTDATGCIATVSGAGVVTRTVTVTGCTGQGTVGISVLQGSATDLDGNLSEAKVSNYATIDNVVPSLKVSAPSPGNGNAADLIVWTLTYTDATEITLVKNDVTLTGATEGCVFSVGNPGGDIRTIQVAGCVGYGYVGVTIAAGTAKSSAGYLAPEVNSAISLRLTNILSAEFVESSSVLVKGSSEATQNFTVKLASPAVADVTVEYILTDFTTAKNPLDFDLVSGTTVIPAGQSTGEISYSYKGNTSSGSRIIQPALTGIRVGSFRGNIDGNQIHRRLIFDDQDLESKFITISSGYSSSCGITGSGKLKCWGDNTYGQLGTGDRTSSVVPIEIDSGVIYTAISVGPYHSCGITAAKQLKCWGLNSEGALGDGTTTLRDSPTPIATNILMVSVGDSHSCSIDGNSELKCWGKNTSGQLGDGTFSQRELPVVADNGVKYSYVSAGPYVNCGITEASELKCWGLNNYGQFGNGVTSGNYPTPLIIQANSSFKYLSFGSFHACGISQSDALYCWGHNSYGQIGDDTYDTRLMPVLIENGITYKSVSLAGEHSCAVSVAGKIKCWGSNANGILGDGTTTNSRKPIPVDVSTNYTMTELSSENSCGLTVEGILKCWGSNLNGKLGDGTSKILLNSIRVDQTHSYSKIVIGYRSTCGVTTLGLLRCSGSNNSGELGDGSFSKKSFFSNIETEDSYAQLVSGQATVCGITNPGVLKCWGVNNVGQAGNGSYANSNLPQVVDPGVTYASVSPGGSHSCGITTEGVLKCWGYNYYGQLGVGTPGTSSTVPVVVDSGVKYIQVSAGSSHTCGITEDEVLKCWGWNTFSQVGDGSGVDVGSPKVIDGGLAYQYVHAGIYHTCGITKSLALKCWGRNGGGELGTGSFDLKSVPTAIEIGIPYAKVVAGNERTCGITADKHLKCWGYSLSGVLGNGTSGMTTTPTRVSPGTYFDDVGLGGEHTCTLTTNSEMKCWGSSADGRLGLGNLLLGPSVLIAK